jgi:hypothetical protein
MFSRGAEHMLRGAHYIPEFLGTAAGLQQDLPQKQMHKHKQTNDGPELAQGKSERNNHKCNPQSSKIRNLLVNRKVLLSVLWTLQIIWKAWKAWQKIFNDNDMPDP